MHNSAALLYARSTTITGRLTLHIPTVAEVIEDEENYYKVLSLLTSTPFDLMVQLTDANIDFTKITNFELFCLLFQQLLHLDTQYFFGSLDLKNFRSAQNTANQELVLTDTASGITIDRAVHHEICLLLQKIHFINPPKGRPGNSEAQSFLIERARVKQQRAANKHRQAQLAGLVVAMVNTEQYKYDFESTLNLTIYQFNSCVHQIVRKINYDHTIAGCYAGTIDMKTVGSDSLDWLSPK